MAEKRTVPKKRILISADGETVSSAIINSVGKIIGWAVRGLGSPLEGDKGKQKINTTSSNDTNSTLGSSTVSDVDANLDY